MVYFYTFYSNYFGVLFDRLFGVIISFRLLQLFLLLLYFNHLHLNQLYYSIINIYDYPKQWFQLFIHGYSIDSIPLLSLLPSSTIFFSFYQLIQL
jgi:hypothetical protein